MTKELDSKDWKILYQLCTDARQSHSKIAKLVNLSKNAVTYRIQRLVDKKIISGFFTIVNFGQLNLETHSILIRLNTTKDQEFIDFLKAHKNVTVVDRLLGEWNFLVEFGCRTQEDFYSFIGEFKGKFSNIIDAYEVHTSFELYKIEQLPVELVEEQKPLLSPKAEAPKKQVVQINKTDSMLLAELNKDSTANLFKIGERVGLTYETVSSKIKKLKDSGVIVKFTAKINLGALGYDVYLILLGMRNLSKEKEDLLKSHIRRQKNIRFSFISASKPTVFVYLAVKKSEELNLFLSSIREKFSDVTVSQKYLLSTDQLKYELFPEGFIS